MKKYKKIGLGLALITMVLSFGLLKVMPVLAADTHNAYITSDWSKVPYAYTSDAMDTINVTVTYRAKSSPKSTPDSSETLAFKKQPGTTKEQFGKTYLQYKYSYTDQSPRLDNGIWDDSYVFVDPAVTSDGYIAVSYIDSEVTHSNAPGAGQRTTFEPHTFGTILFNELPKVSVAGGTSPDKIKTDILDSLKAGVATLKFTDRYTLVGTFNVGKNNVLSPTGTPTTIIFRDSNISDNSYNYQPIDTSVICRGGGITLNQSDMAFTNLGGYTQINTTKLSLPATVNLGASCSLSYPTDSKTSLVVPVGSPDKASVLFTWDNLDLRQADGGGNPYTQTSGQVYRDGTESCSNVIVLNNDYAGNQYSLSSDRSAGPPVTDFSDLKQIFTQPVCYVTAVNLAGSNDFKASFTEIVKHNFTITGEKGKAAQGSACTGGADCQNGVCAKVSGDCTGGAVFSSTGTGCSNSSLDWMICPVIDGISATADSITNFVEGQLNFSVNDNLPESVHKAWAIFKNLVSVIIVIVMLVMVLSQAVGDLISAYTFKKLLPKLVISVIAMQLSWDLCVWMIGLANDAGQGIAQLISLPFGGLNALNLQDLLHRLDATTAVFTGVATGVGGAVAIGAAGIITKGVMFKGLISLGWPILTLVAVSVLISLVAALATLLFRNALIVILVILSPIGILAWVLPGSNRMWKMWKDNFSKTLIFFPLVMAMIYGGRIFAWIAGGLGASGPLDLLMVMLGFFGPYFLLPKSFKWGGSLLSQAAKGVDSSFPIKKSREVANKELMAAQKRSQNALVDKYYRHIMRGEENGPVGRMGRFRHRFINGVIRTAGGHPIPTARSTRVMDQEVGKWKHDEIDLIEGRVGSDYKEFQKLPGMTVQRAKELVRDKYWGKGDKMDRRGFLTWAYNTKSFMEFGQPEWREGYSKDPVTGKMVPPEGGAWEDMVKTQDWIDFMHGNGQAYGDIGQRLGAFVPYRLPLGGGPKPEDFLPEERDANGKVIRELGEKYYEWEKDENGTPIVVDGKKVPVTEVVDGVSVPKLTAEAKLAGGNMQIATLIADSARFEKAIDQAEDPSAIPGWRPEHFEELLHITEALAPKGADGKAHRELIKEVKIDENGNQVEAEVEKGRLIGLENSPGAVELDKFIQEQSRTLAGRNLLQRLSGSAGVHIDSLFGKGYLQSMLERRTGEELNGGGGNGGATPAPVQPKPPKPQPPDTLIVKQGEESKAKGEGSGGGAKEGGPPSEVNLKIDHKALEQTIENSTRIGARRGTLQAFRALKKAGYLGAPPQTGSTAPQEPTDQTPPEEPPKPS